MKISVAVLKILFAFIHLFFFVHLYHQSNNLWFLSGCLILPFYNFLPFEKANFPLKALLLNCFVFSLTFYFTQFFQLYVNAVEAVIFTTGFFIVIAQVVLPKWKKYENVVYAACFSGMVDPSWIKHYPLSILTCLIGGFLYTCFKNSLLGKGGKLGSIGFASLIIWTIIEW